MSFLEETVCNVTLAGLGNQKMQEKCFAAAYMKSISNVQQLVQFCSADEASKIQGSRTVGSLRTIQQGKIETVLRQQKPKHWLLWLRQDLPQLGYGLQGL